MKDTVSRRLECLNLRLNGASYQQIADHLGLTRQRAYQIVEAIAQKACQDPLVMALIDADKRPKVKEYADRRRRNNRPVYNA